MARRKRRTWVRAQGDSVARYNRKTLKRDREYGFYWYAWLWKALRPTLVFVCAFFVVFGMALSGFSYVQTNFFSATEPGSDEAYEFVIERNSSISTISNNLEEQGYIRNKSVFKLIISLQGLSSKIQYGNFQLSRGMDVNDVIGVLTSGSSSQKERTITIIPGWTVRDIGEYFVRIGALRDTEEFYKLCNDIDKFKDDFYAVEQAYASGSVKWRIYMLEGYLAPDTYRVFADASAEDLLRTMLKQTDTVIDRVFYQTAMSEVVYDENGELVEVEDSERFKTTLSQEETIVLASMIEREAGKKSDYAKVSAVFHNRLLKDMQLESDATISYALNINKMVLTSEELNTDNKYNTYNNKGLPVGPICNPSQAAIEAALYPDVTYINEEVLYFCSMDPTTSDLKFSKTLAEHQAAVAEYRPLWEAYDQGQTEE